MTDYQIYILSPKEKTSVDVAMSVFLAVLGFLFFKALFYFSSCPLYEKKSIRFILRIEKINDRNSY